MGVTLGIATAHAGTAVLDGYTGAREQIIGYYAANAREGGGNCGAGHIAAIGDARLVRDSGDSMVLAVDYAYSARSNSGTAGDCSGMASREFTLTKGGAGYTVTAMSGQEP